MGPILALAITLAFSSTLFAQPGRQSTRARDWTAGTADLSGVWQGRQDAITFSPQEPPLRPWAEEEFKAIMPGYGPRATPNSHDPILRCLPPGVPRILLIPLPMQIVQIPDKVIMLFEYDHYIRHIYTDGREHPEDLSPTWMGHSIGKWEGDTLVVETTGFNDQSWLDQVGHPHSDALRLVERIRRVDQDTLQIDITIDDPKAYDRPWTGQVVFHLRPGWNLIEYICTDSMAVPR